jgi:ABC-type transport system involved in cytochrome bd biosynthesis fused ATPase/permease subunit
MFSVQQNFGAQLRERLYHAIAQASWLALSRIRSSDLTHALTSEIDRVEVAVFEAVILASTALLFQLYLGIALAANDGARARLRNCPGRAAARAHGAHARRRRRALAAD